MTSRPKTTPPSGSSGTSRRCPCGGVFGLVVIPDVLRGVERRIYLHLPLAGDAVLVLGEALEVHRLTPGKLPLRDQTSSITRACRRSSLSTISRPWKVALFISPCHPYSSSRRGAPTRRASSA